MASRIVAGSLAVLVGVAAIILTMSAGTTEAAPSPHEWVEKLKDFRDGTMKDIGKGFDKFKKLANDALDGDVEIGLSCEERDFIDKILDFFTGNEPIPLPPVFGYKCELGYVIYPDWARALVIAGIAVLAIILLLVACCVLSLSLKENN